MAKILLINSCEDCDNMGSPSSCHMDTLAMTQIIVSGDSRVKTTDYNTIGEIQIWTGISDTMPQAGD